MDNDEIKFKCKKCGEEKILSEFYTNKRIKKGHENICKDCFRARVLQYNLKHREENAERTRVYNKLHPEKRKAEKKRYNEKNKEKVKLWCKKSRLKNRLKSIYKITKEEYDIMLIQQNGKCYICEEEDINTRNKKLVVDHDHNTGKVRGLLCYSCNIGLGFFHDNIEHLSNAIKYLKNT